MIIALSNWIKLKFAPLVTMIDLLCDINEHSRYYFSDIQDDKEVTFHVSPWDI